MGELEFESGIHNALRKLSREQLEEVALRMALQLNRERRLELIKGIVPEYLERG